LIQPQNIAGILRRSNLSTCFYAKTPVDTQSHLMTSMSSTTTETKYIAASDITMEAILLHRILIQIYSFSNNAVRLMCDNQNFIRLVRNPLVTTIHQLLDIFTKPLPTAQFLLPRSRIELQDSFSNE
jgi:hypothetical protein